MRGGDDDWHIPTLLPQTQLNVLSREAGHPVVDYRTGRLLQVQGLQEVLSRRIYLDGITGRVEQLRQGNTHCRLIVHYRNQDASHFQVI